jgi:phosphate uptake regulator
MNDDSTTVERKVQLTGGSTYTVSLPKEWAGAQGIEPGTAVTLHIKGDQLVMTRGQQNGEQSHETVIDATTQDPAMLRLSVEAAYIAGCETLHVENLRDSRKRRAVTRAIRPFVGFEVMREDETGLSARTMLDVADLSPAQTLAQVERTALDMHAQSVEALVAADSSLGEQVAGQDDTVDRLFALVSRGFQQSLVDPAVTTEGDLSPFEYYMAARQLERVADHAEKMATLAGRLAGPPPDDISEEVVEFGERSRSLVRRALAGLLEGDTESELGEVVTDADTLLADLADIDEQLYERSLEDGYHLGLVVDSLVRTTEYSMNIADAGMQARHRGESG